jgi:predicted dehydrogenase
VGLVGCGRWGAHVLRDLVALGCEVPVVARSDESRNRARAGGAAQVVGEIGALAAVDGVVVATPTTVHPETVRESLALGVPVFVEKPLASDEAAAASLAEEAGKRLFVMDKWRYHPGVRRLAELAADRTLGEVRILRTLRLGWGNPHADADAVWILAPHDLSIALEVLGRALPPSGAVAQVTDGIAVSLLGILEDATLSHVLEVSERSPVRTRRVELHGDDGVAVLGDGWDDHVTVHRRTANGGAREERLDASGELPLLAELRAFVGHLEGGPPPRSSAAEGAHAVATIARLRELAGIP